MVEQSTVNRLVAGSNPASRASLTQYIFFNMRKNKKLSSRHKYDINGILGRADFEIARLKKIEKSTCKSSFRYDEYDYAPRNDSEGIRYSWYYDPTLSISTEEWNKAFERFARKKENIYGQQVDRSKLFRENFRAHSLIG